MPPSSPLPRPTREAPGPHPGASAVRGAPRGAYAATRRAPALSHRGPSSRAVAEGFEPSVTCATLAFEASSFGRSDTLPRESLAQRGPDAEIHGPRRAEAASGAHGAGPARRLARGRCTRASRRSTTDARGHRRRPRRPQGGRAAGQQGESGGGQPCRKEAAEDGRPTGGAAGRAECAGRDGWSARPRARRTWRREPVQGGGPGGLAAVQRTEEERSACGARTGSGSSVGAGEVCGARTGSGPSADAEEACQQRGALVRQDALHHLRPVVEPAVPYEVPQRAHRARLLVHRSEDDAVHA